MTVWRVYGVRELPEGNVPDFHQSCKGCEEAACNIAQANNWLVKNVRWLSC